MVFGAGIVGEALHWFMTVSLRPESSSAGNITVALEGLFGVAIFAWSLFTARREARALRLSAEKSAAAESGNVTAGVAPSGLQAPPPR
jgi:hypothetical protein